MRLAYILLSYLLTPFFLAYLLWRGFRNRAYLERLPERFGFGELVTVAPGVWVHAVSVGEVQAATALVWRIIELYPDMPVLITTVTPTGARRAMDIFGDRVTHRYAPYDLPGAVARFFDRANPRVAIIVETELWPNLYNECGRRAVPLILASARISARSVDKYRRFIGLFREALSHGIVIGAQSDHDADRFRTLGANPARIYTTGNIKFDVEMPRSARATGRALRRKHAGARPVLIAASTHENEEKLVLDAFEKIRASHTDCLLILVPRHPERFGLVAALVEERNFNFVTRTSGELCTPDTDVLLIDTLGELQTIYSAADVAFVGGSLVPVGGHNLLEPAALGVPIVTGSYLFNSEDIAGKLVSCGGAIVVDSVDALAREVAALLDDPGRRQSMIANAMQTIEGNRGAVDKLIALLAPILDAETGAQPRNGVNT